MSKRYKESSATDEKGAATAAAHSMTKRIRTPRKRIVFFNGKDLLFCLTLYKTKRRPDLLQVNAFI